MGSCLIFSNICTIAWIVAWIIINCGFFSFSIYQIIHNSYLQVDISSYEANDYTYIRYLTMGMTIVHIMSITVILYRTEKLYCDSNWFVKFGDVMVNTPFLVLCHSLVDIMCLIIGSYKISEVMTFGFDFVIETSGLIIVPCFMIILILMKCINEIVCPTAYIPTKGNYFEFP